MRPSATLPLAALAVVSFAGCGTNPFDASEIDDPTTGASDPPGFEQVRQEMFEVVLAAESVTITGEVEAGDAELDELFDGIEDDTTGQLSISGALDGSASQMSFSAGGSSFTQLALDGQEYFRGEDFAALLASELDDDVAELVDEEFIDDVVADQWVLFDEAEGSVFSAEDFLVTWQDELNDHDPQDMTAASETREGQEIWVYTEEEGEREYVIAAEEEPYLLAITDEDANYALSEWNASEAPEPPENVITLDEIFDAIAEEQGWVTEEEGN